MMKFRQVHGHSPFAFDRLQSAHSVLNENEKVNFHNNEKRYLDDHTFQYFIETYKKNAFQLHFQNTKEQQCVCS